jgi:aminoglycoside phosphotransferase (APT) family kinase protein
VDEPASDQIREVLRVATGTDPGELRLSTVPGGASRETWLLEGGGGKWVLRRDPEGSVSLVAMREEFGLLNAVRDAGVPVPEPIAFEDEGGRFSSPGMVVSFVEGTSVAPRVLKKPEYETARGRLSEQLAQALARVHSLGRAETSERGLLPAAPPDPALGQIAEWERQLDEIGEPFPAIELGLRWLRANAPEPADPRLVHGDFRLGNFIVDEEGLAAVIDWELAHVGDPAEDVGWLCIRSWRFGNDELPVAGVGDLDGFLAAYESAGADPIERDRIRYWEVFGNVKWAVICARQAHDHLDGIRRSHELASLGRRVCEPEWDMLQLIR